MYAARNAGYALFHGVMHIFASLGLNEHHITLPIFVGAVMLQGTHAK